MRGPDVLVATEDTALLGAVQRLAAVAGVAVRQVAGRDIRAGWPTFAAVVLDAATARWCAQAGLARRPRVLIVTSGEIPSGSWSDAVAVGAEAVHPLPREERQVADWLAGTAEPEAAARTVACLPARGGAGASTLAAALGLAAASRGHDALLVDADTSAGGIDFLLGIEELEGARWDELEDTSGVLSATALSQALPAVGLLRVLSCSRSGPPLRSTAVDAALAAGRRAHAVVVVDLPRVRGAVLPALTACTETTLVVVPAEVRAVAAASAVVTDLAGNGAAVRLVVRQPGPGGLRPRDVSDAVGAPVAAVWPWERRLAQVVEHGRFGREWRRTQVGELARALVDTLTESPA